MFMLYAVVVGLAIGAVLGGHLDGLAHVRLRWTRLALAGLCGQLVLFSAPVAASVGDAGAALYVASTAVVFAAVLRNVAVPGLPLVTLGAGSNLVAIVANGGWMPASPSALASIGASIGTDYSNSRELAAPALAPLTDVFALPHWLPFTNIFSIGDVLIGVGIAVAIVIAMRSSSSHAGRSRGAKPRLS